MEINNFFSLSLFCGAFITIVCYLIGDRIQKKVKSPFFNTLLFAIILVIAILKAGSISYDSYMFSAKYVSYFLTPATICLAVPLYEKRALVVKYFSAIMSGILVSVTANIFVIYLFSLLFSFSHLQYVTFLPKSITTAIGLTLAEEIGGIPNLTVVAICTTGITGHIIAEPLLRNLLKIKSPVAVGIAIGSTAHALGTSKAIEMGEAEGAMSGLAIVLTGILTVLLVPFAVSFI